MREERFGLLSYLKNYVLRIVITLFVSIYLIFILLLLYFSLNILSLRNLLRKESQRKSRQISNESRVNLTEEIKVQGFAGSSASIQMIPLSLFNQTADGGNNLKENGKYFILHVWEFLRINIVCIKFAVAILSLKPDPREQFPDKMIHCFSKQKRECKFNLFCHSVTNI